MSVWKIGEELNSVWKLWNIRKIVYDSGRQYAAFSTLGVGFNFKMQMTYYSSVGYSNKTFFCYKLIVYKYIFTIQNGPTLGTKSGV